SLGDNFLPLMPEVNEKGFWEDRDFNAINIELLRIFGTEWFINRSIPVEQFKLPEVLALMGNAAALVHSNLATANVFAFKDPRTAILLPFWRQVFDRCGVRVAYVITIRNPKSIAESLRKRDNLDEVRTHAMWLTYTLPTLLETAGFPRLLVDYDLMMDAPGEQISRIARTLRLPPVTANELADFVESFLSTKLRHTQYSARDLANDPQIPPTVIHLYSLLLSIAKDEQTLDSEPARRTVTEAMAFRSELEPLLIYLDRVEAQTPGFRAFSDQAAIDSAAASELAPTPEEKARPGVRSWWAYFTRLISRQPPNDRHR
ncbi:MAG: hypothetical protein K9G25_07900, partial [Sphingomonadaceae bacterium]|nr:hypothetical protein [Sphingomonadaceae bacterium]